MTETTTTQATRTCKCGVTITLRYLQGYAMRRWMPVGSERLGDSWCPDGSLHRPGCPPSSVVDMIVTWDEVRDGDLVLGLDGQLDVATVLPQGHAWCPEGHVSICIGGRWFTPRKDRHTAVRRYGEG